MRFKAQGRDPHVVRIGHVLIIATASLCLAAPVFAQSDGSLRGEVLDQNGAPMAGVVLAIVSSSRSVTGRGTVTDSAGTFLFAGLPPAGDYLIKATFPKFAVATVTGIRIEAGRATAVRVVLQPESAFKESIEVRAEPQVVRLEQTSTDTRFSSEFIEGLPILGRNYQDILTLAPGVSDVDGDGNPNIHGARDTDVVTLVDGVSTTDPLTGKIGAQLNIESIQEIEVKTSGASAEFGRAQGGFANILTKSGGNEFRGTFKFYWRSSLLDGDGAGLDDPRLHGGLGELGLRDLSFDDYLPFLSLEGPIVRDRAWFFFASEYIYKEEPVNALSNAFVTGVREWREFAKLTWQASLNHRLSLSINFDPQTYLNQDLNTFTREESGTTLQQGGPIITLRLTSILSPSVSLETALSHFDERPTVIPTLDPDTNGNGALMTDFNGNGFFEARERDAGEDFDNDSRFDVFEDTVTRNRVLDPGEDVDGDRRLTPSGGCEGAQREDADCDGWLDDVPELDVNHDGILDPIEDIDGDGRRDDGTEDRNDNGRLDDTPRPVDAYPYGTLQPLPQDRDYTINQRRGVIDGPYFEDFSDSRTRFTLRQDLGVYVPDWWGSHDLKFGYAIEREEFARRTETRSIIAPFIRSRREGLSTVRALTPAVAEIDNSAESFTGALYVQDNYKPFPNLSIGFGLRFDREQTTSFGYTPFEPRAEREQYDRITALTGRERGISDDGHLGDNNGILSQGILSDPLFFGTGDPVSAAAWLIDPLNRAALGRLTRHHTAVQFSANWLASLYPGIFEDGRINPSVLAELGVVPQQREALAITNNNLAPRLSVSWDPASTGRTKVYATWGRYFDKLFLSTIVGEEGPDLINRYYLLDAAGVTGAGDSDHQLGGAISSAPPSTTQVDRGLQTPFSDEWTVGFERELAPEVAVAIRYINRNYRQQLQDIDVNHEVRIDPSTGRPRDDLGAVDARGLSPGAALPPQPDGRPDLYINNFFFNQVLRVGNFNDASYHGVELEILKRLSRRWEMQASYTYSRALGSAEEFQSRLGNDPSTTELEYGYLDYDQRHVFKLNLSTYLPHEWQIGAAASWASGLPYSIISRFFAFDSFDYQQYRTLYGTTRMRQDQQVFVPLARNSERNHAVLDINLRARKSFVIGRCASALILEVYNLLNRDDLRVYTYEPEPLAGFNITDPTPVGTLQLDGERRFGRRFQIGFQLDF